MKIIKVNRINILEWAILFFAFFPIIPNGVKWIPVATLLFTSLFHFKKQDNNYKWFFINASLYFVYVLSLIYTHNLDFAFKKLETSFSIIILPLIFFIILPKNILKEKLTIKFMKLFVTSSLIFAVLVCAFILSDTSIEYHKNFYSNKYRILVESIPLIGQHPIYASIFLAVALLFSAHLFYNYKINESLKIKLFFAVSIIVNSTLMIMLSSKGVMISLIIILLMISFRRLFRSRNKRKALVSISVIILVLTLLFMYNRRMNEMFIINTYSQVDSNYSNSFRINIYKCANSIIKERWLFGYGIGDGQDTLNECYKNKNELLSQKNYNSHNQYLDIWIKTGIIGLIVFLTFLYLNYQRAIKTNNYVLILILLLYTLNFMTENIISRQSGVILFSFFINFFATVNNKEK